MYLNISAHNPSLWYLQEVVVVESAVITRVDDRRRLPFESISKEVFGGAYGTIDKISIRPKHLKTMKGDQNPEVRLNGHTEIRLTVAGEVRCLQEIPSF
jgi:hypothetical protein